MNDAVLGNNDERIDHAVALEMARRARSRKIIWALVIFAWLVAVIIVVFGYRQRDALRNDVGGDPEFATSVASAVSQEPQFVERLASAAPVQQAAAAQVEQLVNSEQFASTLADSPPIQRQLEAASSMAFSNLAESAMFQDQVREVVSAMPGGDAAAIRRNREAIEALSQQVSSGSDAALLQRLERVETRLRNLATPPAQSSGGRVQELEREVAQLRLQVQESRSLIKTLQEEASRYRVDGAPRSYLLREKSTNALADTALTVTLGAKTRTGVASIAVTDPTGKVVFERESIALGETFKFRDSQGQVYTGALSYSQARFLAKDYVGLELDVDRLD